MDAVKIAEKLLLEKEFELYMKYMWQNWKQAQKLEESDKLIRELKLIIEQTKAHVSLNEVEVSKAKEWFLINFKQRLKSKLHIMIPV